MLGFAEHPWCHPAALRAAGMTALRDACGRLLAALGELVDVPERLAHRLGLRVFLGAHLGEAHDRFLFARAYVAAQDLLELIAVEIARLVALEDALATRLH